LGNLSKIALSVTLPLSCVTGWRFGRRCDIAHRAWHDAYVPVLMILVAVVVLVPLIGHSAGFNFNLMAYVMDRPVDYIESAIQWATGVSYD